MASLSGIVEVRPDVHWVGVPHPDLRVFDDLFPTEHGTTYNAYLIRGAEKTALIDTVKGRFGPELLRKVKRLVDPARLDYVVVNHTEPDHSGALPMLLAEAPRATVLCSATANTFLQKLFHGSFKPVVVKDGEVVDLGGKRLRFIMAPFLHWPDTMFTLLEPGVLFTCDAFGAHYCGAGVFDDEMPDTTADMKFYYDCLIRPFKDKVLSAVEKIRDERIELICPSHGPVLRRDPWQAISLYESWSLGGGPAQFGTPRKVVIFYMSPHGNTGKMSEAVAAGASLQGVEVLSRHITELAEAEVRDLMEEADALVFGVPTINRDVPKPMWAVLSNLSSVKLKTSIAGVFGSYGWSGEACKLAEDRLRGLRFRLPAPAVRTAFTPTPEVLAECQALGRAVAQEVLGARMDGAPQGGDGVARASAQTTGA
jgi:flavorubredoxin